MGAYKKSVFMRDSGMVSISLGEKQFFQLGREDAKELAEMLLKVVDSPLTVNEQQAKARIIPAKDGSGVWFYSSEDNEKFEQALFDEIVTPVERREND